VNDKSVNLELNNSLINADDLKEKIEVQSARGGHHSRKESANKSKADVSVILNEDKETFNTFIVKYVGKREFTFNNIDDPLDGTDKDVINNFWIDKEDNGGLRKMTHVVEVEG